MSTAEETRARVAEVPIWRHRVDVGHGVVTPGIEDTTDEVTRLERPRAMDAWRVLDVGCSDGFYSFEGVEAMLSATGWSAIRRVATRGDRLYSHATRS